MMEEIADGFDRIKVLVSELLTVEKSQRKIEENGMFVKGLLQQLSASTLDDSLDIPNTRTDVAVDGKAKNIISDCSEDFNTSCEFSMVNCEDSGVATSSIVSEEMASPKNTELDISCEIFDSSSSISDSCSTPSRDSAADIPPPSATAQAGRGKSRYEMIREDIIAERNEQLKAMGFFDELSELRSEMTPKKPLRSKVKSPVQERKRRGGWVRRSERLFLSSSEGNQPFPKCKKPDVITFVEEILNSVSQEIKKSDPGPSEFICENCGKEFLKKRYLKKHVKSVHHIESQLAESSRKRAVYSCGKCNFSSMNKRSLSMHKAKAHTFVVTNKGDVFSCDKCNFVNKYKCYVDRHRFIVHKLDEKLGKTNDYACEECDFTSKNKRTLSIHISRAHNESSGIRLRSVHACEQCDFTTKNKRVLSRHISSAHESQRKPRDKIYSCDHCTFVTRHVGNLRRHQSSFHRVDSTTNIVNNDSDTESIDIFTDDSDNEDTPVASSIM